MKTRDILEHFLSRSPWVDRNTTVDRIILGDPDREIRRVLVSWMSTMPAVRYAVENGFDMLMTHEPTFWLHRNEIETLDAGGESAAKMPAANAKRGFIGESGLVVMRNHDVWDRFPGVGIPWALARHLGLEGKPAATGADGYQLAFTVGEASAGELARRIAGSMAALGEPALQLFGDAAAKVRILGIGTGCCCQPDVFLEMGCDCAVICDDGCWYWRDIAWALEAGLPLIRVSHGASEEPGMVTLADYINGNLPGVSAEHYKLRLEAVLVHG